MTPLGSLTQPLSSRLPARALLRSSERVAARRATVRCYTRCGGNTFVEPPKRDALSKLRLAAAGAAVLALPTLVAIAWPGRASAYAAPAPAPSVAQVESSKNQALVPGGKSDGKAPVPVEEPHTPHGWSDEVGYSLQKLFQMDFGYKVLVIALFMGVCVGTGGLLYHKATGEPLNAALFTAYSVLINIPGVAVTVENESPQGLIVSNLLFAVGLLTFAVFIGTVTDSISTKVEEVRTGNYAVVEKGHSVILGWNDQALPLLRQLAIVARDAEKSSKEYSLVAVLSEMPREDIQDAIQEAVADSNGKLRVVTREGSPADPNSLKLVAAQSARNVIVLHPGEGTTKLDPEAAKAVAVLGLTQQAGSKTRVVVQMVGTPEEDLAAIAASRREEAGALDSVQFHDGHASLARQLGQCAYQPNLSRVYRELFEQSEEGSELYVMPLPEALSGRTFGQAWRSFDCTVIGYLRPGSEPGAAPDVRIGPMDSDVLQPGDALAVIAQDMREAKRVRATQAEVHSFTDVPVKKVQRDPLKIVVAAGPGTDFGRLKPLLSGIAAFAPGGSCVTVLADSVAAAEMRSVSTSNCTFQTLAGFATSRADLLKAGVDRATNVVLLEDDSSTQERNAKMLTSLLILQDVKEKTGFPKHVVAEANGETSEVLCRRAAGGVKLDLLDRDSTVAGSLLGDVMSPMITKVVSTLVAPFGHEVYIKKPILYVPEGAKLTGWQVAGLVRSRGDIFLGYITAEGDLKLNPDKSETRAWSGVGERLVVLSEEP